MVKAFEFAQTPNIIFGQGKIADLPRIVKVYGGDVLVVSGKRSFTNSKHGEFVFNTFELTGIRYHHFQVNSEPSPEMIDKAVVTHKPNNIGLVVAIGGGSVIDGGKAISAMLTVNNPIMEYLEGVGTREHPGTKIPFIAIPTTAGTGSEATKNAVISEVGPAGFKKSLRHNNFMPDYALVDPELTLSCPPNITASSGMDCFTQLVESYLSDQANSLTDAIALDGLLNLKDSLISAWRWGQNIEARSGMSYAALISGITLANASLGVVHGFASSIGGMFNIPHGVVCGTLMGITNRVNVEKLRKESPGNNALSKYANLGKLFTGEAGRSDEWYIDAFLSITDEWTSLLNIPKLGSFGITNQHYDSIIAKTGLKSNPVKLGHEELFRILETRT